MSGTILGSVLQAASCSRSSDRRPAVRIEFLMSDTIARARSLVGTVQHKRSVA
jgi:hypothetical protein